MPATKFDESASVSKWQVKRFLDMSKRYSLFYFDFWSNTNILITQESYQTQRNSVYRNIISNICFYFNCSCVANMIS